MECFRLTAVRLIAFANTSRIRRSTTGSARFKMNCETFFGSTESNLRRNTFGSELRNPSGVVGCTRLPTVVQRQPWANERNPSGVGNADPPVTPITTHHDASRLSRVTIVTARRRRYQPRPAINSLGGRELTLIPTIGSPRFLLISPSFFGSLWNRTDSTIATARFFGSPDLKM